MYSLRLLSVLRPYWRRVLVATICVIAAGASILAVPQLIRWGIDYGLDIQQVDGKPVATGEERLLVVAALGVVGFAVLRGIFAYGQTYLAEWISQRVAYDLRNGIYDRLQRLSYAYHDQQQTGQLMSRATQDVEAVRMFVNMRVVRGAYIGDLLAASLSLRLIRTWELALVV